jgi:hypothetical protein
LPVGGFQSSLISALATLMPDAEQDWGDDRHLAALAATPCWITQPRRVVTAMVANRS